MRYYFAIIGLPQTYKESGRFIALGLQKKISDSSLALSIRLGK
jgi:hypothetical protein